MLPIAAMAAGGALQAGMGGLQKWMSGNEQEEQAKKQALMNLTQKFQKDSTFAPVTALPKAPGFGETVVAPMAQTAAGNAASGALSSALSPSNKVAAEGPLKGTSENMLGQMADEDKNDTWYRKAARDALGRK